MWKINSIFIFGLIVLPAILLMFDNGMKCMAYAQYDDADDEMEVEGEETGVVDEGGESEGGDTAGKTGASPEADTTVLFIKPLVIPATTLDLPAGNLVEFLVGFLNKGNEDFVLETLDASFRYPMDFNFYIQNFSTLAYERPVKPGQEATLAYSFVPSETYAGRPFGLSINLRYRDMSGNQFYEGVYNETVNIVELEEGLDGETFFLYVFLGACGVLLLVIGQQFLVSVGRKRVGTAVPKRPPVETGTTNHNNVDYDWLPKETLQSLNKSPRVPKSSKTTTSPKTRKVKRSAGFDD